MARGGESKTGEDTDTVGIVLLSQGQVKDYCYVASNFERPVELTFKKEICSPGVSQIILTDSRNEEIAARYFFTGSNDSFDITYAMDKGQYKAYQPITISLSLNQKDSTPVTDPFSMSVRDGSTGVEWNRNILTDMLLMSDIRGYVANPAYYFESDDDEHRRNLDLLLMVQTWRRYPWNRICNLRQDNLRYKPETKGILVEGLVSSFNMKKPKKNIDISALMLRNKDEEDRTFFENRFTTDSLGRFSFIADIDGDWKMVLAASKNMKKQNLTISLVNRLSPEPRPYAPFELKVNTIALQPSPVGEIDDTQTGLNLEDTITEIKNDKAIMLKNIEVKGKKSSKEYDIYRARANSVAAYDFEENYDRMVDEGYFYCNDVNAFLCSVNENFHLHTEDVFNYLTYKQRIPLVVVDYEVTYLPDEFRYNDLPVEWIKSVYISEDFSLISQYADPALSRIKLLDRHRCVVFIETYPEESRPSAPGTGVRRSTFHGYDIPTEFYNPDYSSYLPEEDHRRTLYWNPMLQPDSSGFVQVKLFNNGTCKRPIVDAQTITAGGLIGISRQKESTR